jgi:hypothetical protein
MKSAVISLGLRIEHELMMIEPTPRTAYLRDVRLQIWSYTVLHAQVKLWRSCERAAVVSQCLLTQNGFGPSHFSQEGNLRSSGDWSEPERWWCQGMGWDSHIFGGIGFPGSADFRSNMCAPK